MLRLWLCWLVADICLVGCGNDSGFGLHVDGGSEAPDGGDQLPAEPPGPPSATELPCDVKALLANRCQNCHGTTPSNGAPMALVTYHDLTTTNAAGVKIADRALSRIQNPTAPMPPGAAPSVTMAELQPFEAWATAGTPANSSGCAAAPPGPFEGPIVCTSRMMWRGGNEGSQVMHPGMACITCHLRGDDASFKDPPQFRIAGTVYPTGHEPNDCNGATNASVEITDASNQVTTLTVNSAGNFFTTQAIQFPIHVAVLAGGKRRMMSGSPPRGDCNSCHTATGANGAPGRITIPY